MCRLLGRNTGKGVRASCKVSKGSDLMETQMKQNQGQSSRHMGPWSQDCKDWVETHSSGGLHFLWNETDDDKNWPATLYSWNHRLQHLYHKVRGIAGTHGPAKALVLSLKQFHAHFCRLYKKGTTGAMVGLQGLHSTDTFWHPNVSASMDLKSFCPWYFKFRGNTKTIATHLRDVHYRLAIACDICHAFTSMSCASGLRASIKVQHEVAQEV